MIDPVIGYPVTRGEIVFVGDYIFERRFHVVWYSPAEPADVPDKLVSNFQNYRTYCREFMSRDLALAFVSFVLVQYGYAVAKTTVTEVERELKETGYSTTRRDIPMRIISFVIERTS